MATAARPGGKGYVGSGSLRIMGAVRVRSWRYHGVLLAAAAVAALGSWTTPLRAQTAEREVLDVLSAVVEIRATVPAVARTAATLGTERTGSGVLIDSDGLIVTIGYLILEASDVSVVTAHGETVPATIIAYDHETGFGLLRATGALNLKPMRLGSSDRIGKWEPLLVSAFGGPGVVRPAVAVSRREFAGYWEYLLEDAIFTSPPYPMFGGAALMDSNGQLVGIGSLVVGDAVEGERTLPGNMFLPIDALKSVMADLLTSGRASSGPRPWIGIYSQETADGHVVVQRLAEDGPASTAGIRAGDVIAQLDGERVSTLSGMYRRLWNGRAPGDPVRITVLRGTELQEFNVTTGDRDRWLRLTPEN